jgi:hypothetical protein
VRRCHGVDANQAEIVKALRQAGRSVVVLAKVGNGVPDLLVGWLGICTLLEVKDGAKPPSAQKLTPAEAEFHRTWRGPVHIVRSVDEALAVTGVIVPPRRVVQPLG